MCNLVTLLIIFVVYFEELQILSAASLVGLTRGHKNSLFAKPDLLMNFSPISTHCNLTEYFFKSLF